MEKLRNISSRKIQFLLGLIAILLLVAQPVNIEKDSLRNDEDATESTASLQSIGEAIASSGFQLSLQFHSFLVEEIEFPCLSMIMTGLQDLTSSLYLATRVTLNRSFISPNAP
ncbi:MAG: hypothetical protein AAF789_06155 [Bacteroidota bacterium]